MWVVDRDGALREVRGVESLKWRLLRVLGWYLRFGRFAVVAVATAWIVVAVFFDYFR
jgi:hypothetical protein